CVSLIRKNKNVFADLSALVPRPWQFYNAMLNVAEYGVPHKVLFGTDFPFFTVERTVAAFRGINDLAKGTALPRIPDEVIESIIARDAAEALGLRAAAGGRA
ncbi:amidohydrolase family protein, partial [Cohnella zeiphila]